MKVFISADIEGITTTTTWDDCELTHSSFPLHAKQMTEEVLACIRGAKKAGAVEIVVNDAHNSAVNIDPTRMPSGVTLLRGWSGHPYSMAYGIDNTFDAAMFVGYHTAASRPGNPMSHTNSGSCYHIKINDITTSEFLLYSYACALECVPTVFLSGDKMLCEDSADLHPGLITCAVKDGIGKLTKNYSTEDTIKKIEDLSYKALTQDLKKALVKLPDNFIAEYNFKEHRSAERASHFPGVIRKSDLSVTFKSDSFFEVLRTHSWIV